MAVNLIKFKGGASGARVYICPDNVCSVQDSISDAPGTVKLTDINTADGKSHTVQGDTDDVAKTITGSSS